MKKTYSAPRLYAEPFMLCEHSSGCGAPSAVKLLADRSLCGYALDSSGVTVFDSGVGSCNFQIEGELDYDLINGMCYNNAVENIGQAYGS